MAKIVIVGGGMVAYKFCEKLFEKSNAWENFEIVLLAEEDVLPYDRVHLSARFSGSTEADLHMASSEWYSEKSIDLRLNSKVTILEPESKSLTVLEDGKTETSLSYDYLVLATGSSAFVPPVPGVDLENVFVYRTLEDVKKIMDSAKGAKKAAVIGGGLLGLEAAKALVDLDVKESHVVEFASRLMPRQIDESGSRLLESKIEELGVEFHLNKASTAFLGSDKVEGIKFQDDSTLEVDMVVISAGIRPRDELAKESGLEVGERGGIVVDGNLKTSDKSIFAIGECALAQGMIYGLVAPGYKMADTAVETILSEIESEREISLFLGSDMSTKLKLMGVDVSSIGDPFAKGKEIVVNSAFKGVYKKLVVDDELKLLGAILIGDNDLYSDLYNYYLSGESLPEDPESLLVPQAAGTAQKKEMSDSALICSCENVTCGDVKTAIKDGYQTLDGIKACTKAGTGCGSCVGLINNVLNSELEKSGQEIDKSLCEHFSYTRVELAKLIRKNGVKTFNEALGRFGQGGLGCKTCKPVVASILASYFNEHIVGGDHHSNQDSNDRFLANIQKNGSYSIVPRVPGGEITPDQLIVIGQVAKDYDLYTKITGGQRIDLFGARMEQLPEIWEKLIDAGFESGHAYAKSLRTVKSCVGSTWCRFGVQDSTTMAIALENRYKGLRAPHKIKFAVSGCARECAEAQSKDIGVIATEKGWNLYVAGNGGMKPRHADLFAVDLDDRTLVSYIDRILMYYVRTAPQLTRTSVWLENLEGGLEFLQGVVIDNTEKLADELELEMQFFVDTYLCEWKQVLKTPNVKERFQPFLNSDEKDETIKFKRIRQQIAPDMDESEDEAPLQGSILSASASFDTKNKASLNEDQPLNRDLENA